MNIYFRYFREFSVAALIIFAPLEAIAVCGRLVTGSHCDVIPFDVFEEIGSEFSAVIIGAYSDGHGSVRFDSSGLIEYLPSPLDVGDTVDVTVVYFLDQDTTQQYTCVTGIIVTNNRPTISCPDTTFVVRGSTVESARVSISDRDPCDAIFLRILEINPKPFGEVSINQRGPRIVFSADKRDAHRVDTDYEILIEVSDKIEADTCAMIFTVLHEAPICLRLSDEYSVFQNQVVRISVVYDSGSGWFNEFDLSVGFGKSDMSFLGVFPGNIFDDRGWSEFENDFSTLSDTGALKDYGIISVRGARDDRGWRGGPSTGLFQPGDTLVHLFFKTSRSRNLLCSFLALRWLWVECDDNTLFSSRGRRTYFSSRVYDYNFTGGSDSPNGRADVTDSNKPLPTLRGAPQECIEFAEIPAQQIHYPRLIDFKNGGMQFPCPTDYYDRGDINGNLIPFEEHDAKIYCNWFVYGDESSGLTHGAGASAADINRDGVLTSVEDFVNMMRIMTDDSIAIDRSSHFADTAVIFCRNSVYVTDTELGAAYFTFEGDADITLLADNMSMRTAFHNGATRAIVYSFGKEKISPGKIISCDRQLLSLDAADYFGHALGVSSDSSLFDYSKGVLEVRISQTKHALPGAHQQIHIVIDNGLLESGGFDFMIEYDSKVLSFTGATAGNIFVKYGWEFFTYRFGPNGSCTGDCPTSKLRVIAIANTNNGPTTPNDYILRFGDTLATLNFLVSNDRNFICNFAPIRWLWLDCGDNAFSSRDGNELFSSNRVFEFQKLIEDSSDSGRVELTDPFAVFPTNGGAPLECDTSFGWRRGVRRNISFLNGGVGIACPIEIDGRGDLNLNGLGFEIADGVLYCMWLVNGYLRDYYDLESSIFAADINIDGNSPTLEDFVYFIRHVTGDAVDVSELNHFADTVIISNVSRIYSCDRGLGAIFFEFPSSAQVELLAENMTLKTGPDNASSRVLVSDVSERGIGTERIAPGAIIRSDIAPIKIEAADYNGNALVVVYDFQTSIGDANGATLPTIFALRQNYPNPFNPSTTIEVDFPHKSVYTLTIYNILGRVVERFTGAHEAGTLRFSWDGASQPSGVYFYRLKADAFTASKSMMLIK